MTYWGGAQPNSGKCACGMTNSCLDPKKDVTVIRTMLFGAKTVGI